MKPPAHNSPLPRRAPRKSLYQPEENETAGEHEQ